jgi:hypothetical protein
MPNVKPRQKELAKHLYFTTSSTQKDIAAAVGVTPKCMSHWVRTENWTEQKKSQYYSPEQLTHELYNQLRDINNTILKRNEGERRGTKEELEANTKILALITNLAKAKPDSWRNINSVLNITASTPAKDDDDTTAVFQYGDKQLGKIKMGEIPMGKPHPDGTYSFSEEVMHEYYSRVAMWLAVAESGNEPFTTNNEPTMNQK